VAAVTRDPLTPDEVDAALRDLPGWTGDAAALRRTVTCPTFRDAVALVDAVADAAEELDHHPDIDLRYRDVTFALSTHTAGGVTAYDVELARRIGALVTLG
jgi:4a-hydroxytetrahydrobiopterin dehydratase